MADSKKNGTWKYYNDSEVLFSVKQYNNDSLLYNLDVNNFIFSKQRVCNGSIEFIMPKEWKVSSNLTNKKVVFIAFGKKDDDGFAPSLSIISDTIGNKSFEQYVDYNLELLPQQLENYYEVYRGATTYKNGIEGRRFAYAFQVNGFKLAALLCFLKLDSNKVLIINVLSSNVDSHFLKYKGLFEEITASFTKLKE